MSETEAPELDDTTQAVNAFSELFGKIPDSEIANLADVDVDDVADAREAAGVDPYEEPSPAPAPEPEPEPAPRRRPSRSKAKAAPAKVVKAIGEAALAAAPLVIKLLRTVRYTVRTPSGRLLSMSLPQSVYRGEMAERVMTLVHPEDRDAIERVS